MKKMTRPVLFIISMVLIAVITCGLFANLFVGLSKKAEVSSAGYLNSLVVIDAGHGGFDPGAVYGGRDEKDINLAIALQLQQLFEAAGYTVIMTRTADNSTESDSSLSLSERKTSDIHNRVKIAEEYPNCTFISIHQNSFSDRRQWGTQVFYGVKNSLSKPLADYIMDSVKGMLQPDNKRQPKAGTGSIYILKNCPVPTVLVECGFMTNEAELKRLNDTDYIKKISFCIFTGYLKYEEYLKGNGNGT